MSTPSDLGLPLHLCTAAELAAARLPLKEASTLPPSFYTEPEFYKLEVERLLSKQWLCVGRVDQVSKPGDYFTIELLGEPLVIVRDQQNQLHALSRVCRHRAMSVIEGAGNRSSFQCPYHRWTYALSGELIGAPAMQEAAGFQRANCRLPELRIELWLGFLLVNFDPGARPFAPPLQALDRRFTAHRLSTLKTLPPLDYSVACNWKLFVENFVEFYHHAGTHPNTVERWAPTKIFRIDDSDGPYTFNHALPGHVQTSELPIIAGLSAEEQPKRHFGVVYPLHAFIVTSVGMFYFQILPDAADHLTLRIFPCLPEETLGEPQHAESIARHLASIDIVTKEDIATCEAVQKGFHSRFARPGRISHLELGVWRFNQYILDALFGPGSGAALATSGREA